MPNFDTGHLFLTFLSPIKLGTAKNVFGAKVSGQQAVRDYLGLLPTALQSPVTQRIGVNSPFSRNRQTHLCRFVVLEDVIYNGRNPQNPILASLSSRIPQIGKILKVSDPIVPQPVDKLNTAYLLFCVDIDAVMEEGEPLPKHLDEAGQSRARDAYLRRLWKTMEPELSSIYGNCFGFDGVKTADDFARYMARCQIETTMPFNDYWISPPDLEILDVKRLALVVGVPFVAMLLGLLAMLVGMETAWLFWIGLVALVIAGVWAYREILKNGQKPMPPAAYGDLPSVLKSLYLQQNFADFVVENQGMSDAKLHEDFGKFLDAHEPESVMSPSQHPGVISIRADNAVIR